MFLRFTPEVAGLSSSQGTDDVRHTAAGDPGGGGGGEPLQPGRSLLLIRRVGTC